MENDMSVLLAEGGVNTGNAEIDPVSGNEVPPGSLPEEVRDDVDAKLSGGEYVVPADVLRYYGVSFFEKLRKKAKEGLAEMDSEGRIGGSSREDNAEEDDDLPFSDEELMYEDEEMEFAEGGVVPPGGIQTFNPNQFYSGFSAFGGAAQPQAETKTYVNAEGTRMSIQFINGQPQQPIPAGFYPEGQVPAAQTGTTLPGVQKPDSPNRDEQRSQTRQNTEETTRGLDWAKGQDWKNMTPEQATSLANSRLEGNKFMQAGAQALGALNPLAGLAAGVGVKMRPVAEVNGMEKALRALGNDAAADAVAGIGDKYMSERGLGMRAMEDVIAPGTLVSKQILAGYQQPQATSATPKQGTSAAGKTFVKDGDRSGGTGPQKGVISQTGGSSQKKGSPAPTAKAAPAKSTPTKSSPSKTSKTGNTARAEGGLIERRKK